MTEYELASLRLRAFELLDGWGERDEKDRFIPNNFERRTELAAELVKWASGEKDEKPQ